MEDFNKVILLGGNHHNGLGLARIFGINGIKPYGIIIGKDSKRNFICKSKYWEQTWTVTDENEAIDLLKKIFWNEKQKPVLIPWSDGAAQMIDSHLDELKEYYIAPSIAGRQGAICELMDKQNQVEFASKYGIPMAKTWTVYFGEDLPSGLLFPCIVKPVASYEGNKSDIRKCDNESELIKYLDELKEKGYRRALIQEFLKFDYEFLYEGCCGADVSYIVSENVRTWPSVGGTGSFAHNLADKKFREQAALIIDALQEEGFNGLFDIDMFSIGDDIYLNEVNWRNGGRDFMCIGTKVFYPLIWYFAVCGQSTVSYHHFCDESQQYAMDEATDLRHVFFRALSFKQWNEDRKKTNSFALWYAPDLRPTIARYLNLFKILLLGRKG